MKKLIILLLGSIGFVFSQNVEFTKENLKNDKNLRKAYRFVKKGDKYYEGKDTIYAIALHYYVRAYEYHKNSAVLNYKLADGYLHTFEKYKANEFAENLMKLNPNVAYDANFVYGWSLQNKYKFDEAIKYFNMFVPVAKGDSAKMVQKHIDECNNGKKYIVDQDYVIRNLGSDFNTPYNEYTPVVSADGNYLFFTSRRPSQKKVKFPITNFKHYYFNFTEDIYRSDKKDSNFVNPGKLKGGVNTVRRNDACVNTSQNGGMIYIYRGNPNGDIYYEKLNVDGTWKKAKPVPGCINTKYREMHISVTQDDQTAYVVSDRPGGYGGFDIWKVTKTNNVWDKFENLGPDINTMYNEEGVFIHPDGKTMYFSSEGHDGMGGYDLYESNMDANGKWSKPINMGMPINSPDDDIFLVTSKDGNTAYLASVKETGYGKQDIYSISRYRKKIDMLRTTELFQEFTVDKTTNEMIIADKVTVKDEFGNVVYVNEKNNKPETNLNIGGKYTIEVEKFGYKKTTEEFIVKSSEENKFTKTIALEKLPVETTTVTINENKVIKIENVYFDYNLYDLKSQAVKDLDNTIKTLKENPDVTITIEGFADSDGEDNYNVRLSKNRANAVYNYLIKNGLAANRIKKITPYGEAKPAETNDTEEGRAKNRRVEIKIVK